MEIKTCEQYVLAKLDEAERRAEQYASDHEKLGMLKQIFSIRDNPETGDLDIGVNDALLDPTKDAGAVARILLLKDLFGTEPLDLPTMFGGMLMPAGDRNDERVNGDYDGDEGTVCECDGGCCECKHTEETK